MDGRAFLDVADELAADTTEAHWRAAAGRGYYGLLHEAWAALVRWSFVLPPRESVHSFVRLRFSFAADPDLQHIGRILDELSRLRNKADYHLAAPGQFAQSGPSAQAVRDARDTVALLDSIDGDPVRQAAAIAAIRVAWP